MIQLVLFIIIILLIIIISIIKINKTFDGIFEEESEEYSYIPSQLLNDIEVEEYNQKIVAGIGSTTAIVMQII